MAKKAELKAVLSMDMSPFARGAAKALATGKALARQFARNPVKLLATGAFLGAEKAIGAIGSGIGKLPGMAAKAFGTLAKAGAVIGGVFAAGVVHAYNFGSEMQDMADRTGMPIGKLMVLTQALKDSGVEFEALVPAVKKMNVALVTAAKSGNGSAFTQIGLSVEELLNKEPADQFEAIATAISKLGSTAARTKAAVDLFGKSGVNMLSFFSDAEAMKTARDSLGKQAGILEKNAAVFDRISDRLGRVGAKIRGFFIGAGAGLAGIVDNLTAQFDKVDLAPFGEKVAEMLKDGMKWGFAIWEDPKGVMGYFWEVAKTKALELANWLHDAIEGAFPGMAVAIEDAISKTIAWGKIIIGYAIQFGEMMLGAAQGFTSWITAWWEGSGIPELLILLKEYAVKPVVKFGKGVAGSAKEIASDPVSGILKYGFGVGPENATFDLAKRFKEEAAQEAAEASKIRPLSEVFPDMMGGGQGEDSIGGQSRGEKMVAEGMAQLAKKASGAAEALESAKVGADHFGAKAQAEKAEAMRNKIEPAVKKAQARMNAIGGGEEKKAKRWQSLDEWRNQQIRNLPQLVKWSVQPKLNINAPGVRVGGLLSHREMEGFRTRAAAQGIASLDGVATRRPGEVHAGDAARKRAFDKEQERKRRGDLTDKETLDEMLTVAKDARDANQKVAIAIAQ